MGCGSSTPVESNSPPTKYPKNQAQQQQQLQQGHQQQQPQQQQQLLQQQQQPPPQQQRAAPPQTPAAANNGAPAPGIAASKPVDPNPSKAALDKSTLLRYVEIEKAVNQLEARNVVQHLQMKWEELKSLEDDIRRLTAIFQSCQEHALKEKKDVDNMQEPSVRGFFADQTSFDARISKEQEEFLAALNKQEVAQKELEVAASQRESAKVVVKELHMQAEELQKLYKEQDQILAAIFDSKYGSDLEYRLEHEHDVTCEKQQRISAAKTRWQAARLLVQHAHSQLGYAVQRWDYICRIPAENNQMRYGIATEVRNYLIAASTNLRNSQGYLRGIDFPYCKIDEVNTLERATNNIYGDMATPERHQHAMNVYRSIFQRSHALLQWFDVVIDKTIDRDLNMAIEELFAKKRELRIERVRLIRERLVELFGAQEAAAAGLDEDGNLTDARRLQEQLSKVNEEELRKQLENVKVVQPEKVQQPKDGGAAAAAAEPAAGDSKPADDGKPPKAEAVSLKELAPPPSQDQLFGDIDSIKKQYEIDMEEFQRAQDVNRARVEQGLQEKLAARKSRKARKMAQQEQTEKLLQESGSA